MNKLRLGKNITIIRLTKLNVLYRWKQSHINTEKKEIKKGVTKIINTIHTVNEIKITFGFLYHLP